MLTRQERDVLSESRLLPLVEKVRGGRFAELATSALITDAGEAGQVNAGFSNGFAINDWFVRGPAGRHFGWQIQGNQFRLVVLIGGNDPRPRVKREALVAELYESYFDFTLPDQLSHVLGRYTGRKQWLGYEPNFVYRFAPLSLGASWQDLLGLAQWFSRRAREVADGHRGDTTS